jgi:hypothetical protein
VRSFLGKWNKRFNSRKAEVPKTEVPKTEVAVEHGAQLGAEDRVIVIDGSDTVKAGEWASEWASKVR